MLVGFGAVATAAEPLVHSGEEAAAVARAAEATRLAPEELAPTAFEALRGRAPSLTGGTLLPCEGEAVTREQLLLALQGVSGALAAEEQDRARTELARVAAVESCAPADRDLLARYWTARALLDDDPATGFQRARALAPELAVDPAWPADRAAAFEAAAPSSPVSLVLPFEGYAVDGAPARGTVPVVPGWHVVAGPSFRGAIVLDVDGTLVVPQDVPSAAFQALDDEAGRALPTALFADAFGEGARVFVVNDTGVWAATAGRTDWLALQRQKRHPLVGAGLVTTGAGVAATALGGVLARLAWSEGQDRFGEVESATDPTSFRSASAALADARGPYTRGLALVGIGGVVTAAGLAVTGVGASLGPVTVGGDR